MNIKHQFSKIKDNWLIIVLTLVLLLVFGSGILQNFSSSLKSATSRGAVSSYGSGGGYDSSYAESGVESMIAPSPSSDFAPEETERKIVKTANIETEVERGEFQASETKLKEIVSLSDALVIDENVNKAGETWKGAYQGYYQLKVESAKYDSMVSQLKEIGDVQSFTENTDDVTGAYTNLELNLELEKDKLKRYNDLYAEAEAIEDKLDLNDRIFYQERTVKYLQDALDNIGQRVEYSTVYFTMNEKESGYVNVDFVDFSTLVAAIVGSTSALLSFLFLIAPWAVAVFIVRFVWKYFKNRRK